ncbi:PH domain protein [Ichthyophthirius multifiliis]|uniref:PH domain protein n=1 Tax=Ichthyophthirius multifiliis TaxID=5932 RepID=G0QP67_ICHMU|nr:PH domain protein [Ichthyophthirius multifiliis]EGR32997.1 PH domain protein [Ichthyophthirius multifiliis]|eukprot:XP_004036983.1 PH domain protein [Ichthyophthirius multifiliis]
MKQAKSIKTRHRINKHFGKKSNSSSQEYVKKENNKKTTILTRTRFLKIINFKNKIKIKIKNIQKKKKNQFQVKKKNIKIFKYKYYIQKKRKRYINLALRQFSTRKEIKDLINYGAQNKDLKNKNSSKVIDKIFTNLNEGYSLCDLKLVFVSQPDGEKLIKINLFRKNLVFLNDFVDDLVKFFRTPFNGSDDIESKYFFKQPDYNNYPPMVVKILAKDIWAIIHENLNDYSQNCLAINLDVDYLQEWIGDSFMGPGSAYMDINANLNRVQIFKSEFLYKAQQYQGNGNFTNQEVVIKIDNNKIHKFRNIIICISQVKKIIGITSSLFNPSYYTIHRVTDFRQIINVQNRIRYSNNKIHDILYNQKQSTENFYIISNNQEKIINYDQIQNFEPIRMSWEQIQAQNIQFQEKCINVMKIQLQRFKIEVLKNSFGNQISKIKISKLIMKKITKYNNYYLGLKGCLKIKYFNKRKQFYEPFLEPWTFFIRKKLIDSQISIQKHQDIELEIKNFVKQNKIKNEEQQSIPESVQLNENSLNINISTAFLETAIETANIYSEPQNTEDPYQIQNNLGYGVLFTIGEKKKIYIENLLQQFVESGKNKNVQPKFTQEKDQNNNPIKNNKSRNFLVNFIILNEEKDKRLNNLEQKYMNNVINQLQKQLNQPQRVQGNQQDYAKAMNFLSQFTLRKNKTQFNQTQQESLSSTAGNEKNIKGRKLLITKNFSEYRTINNVSLDFVGKQFYEIESINSDLNNEVQKQNKEQQNKLMQNFMFTSKKRLPGWDKHYFVLETNIDQKQGHKMIRISSSINLYNNLNENLKVYLYLNPTQKNLYQLKQINQFKIQTQSKQQVEINKFNLPFIQIKMNINDFENIDAKHNKTQTKTIFEVKKNQNINIPLQYLEKFAFIGFEISEQDKKYQNEKNQQQNEEKDINFYALSDLIRNNSYISDFETDDENIFVDILGQIEDKNTRLVHKQDVQIDTQESFFFISTIKNRQIIQSTYKTKETENFCYDTILVVNPVLKITNATVLNFQIQIGDQQIKKVLFMDQSVIPYKVKWSQQVQLSIKKYDQKDEKTTQQNKFIHINVFPMKFKKTEVHKLSGKDLDFFLHFEHIKISKHCREIIMYIPYLIHNKSQQDLVYSDGQYLAYYKKYEKNQKYNIANDIEQIKENNMQNSNIPVDIQTLYQNKVQVLSSSNNIRVMKFAFRDTKTALDYDWSQKISLQQKNNVNIPLMNYNKNEFEFNVNIRQCQGSFYRTNIIEIKPKYYIFNFTSQTLDIFQYLDDDNNVKIFTLQSQKSKEFFWVTKSYKKAIQLQIIDFNDIKDKQETQQPKKKFSISREKKINDFAVKLPFLQNQKKQYKYITVNILFQDNVICIKLSEKQQPPYIIYNQTSHEIFIQQFINNKDNRLMCCGSKKKNFTTERKIIFPKQRIRFTWDHWILDSDKQIQVEIEQVKQVYNLDKLKNYEPITLQKSDNINNNIQNQLQKQKNKLLFKKGYLNICDNFKNVFRQYFCVLDINKQKIKLYIINVKYQTIKILGAKLEQSRNGFLITTNTQKMFEVKIQNQSKEYIDWYNCIHQSILVNTPEKVDFKIEPRNGTMEITFFVQRIGIYNNNNNSKNKVENELITYDEDGKPFQTKNNILKVSISNMIGISIIDNKTFELFSISFKNLQCIYSKNERYIKEVKDNDQEKLIDNKSQIDEMENNQDQFQNEQIKKKNITKNIQNNILQFSVENIFVNNQNEKAQFPVVFASDKKKTGENPPPFIFIQVNWKNIDNQEVQDVQEERQKIQQSIQSPLIQNASNLQNHPQIVTSNKTHQNLISQQMNQKNNFKINAINIEQHNDETKENQNIQEQMESQQSLYFQAYHQKESMQWINSLQVYIDHFEIRIDQQIIQSFLKFKSQIDKVTYHTNEVNKPSQVQMILENFILDQLDDVLQKNLKQNQTNSKKAIYIKHLHFQPIDFCLTLNMSDNQQNYGSLKLSPLAVFQQFGLELVSIDQANIKLNALNQSHLYDTPQNIQTRIFKHYTTQFMIELYKIFGSFQAIGNPVKLVNEITSSVSKMIYDPLKALTKGNGKQAIGDFAQGALTLVQNTIQSVYKTIKNITGFFARIIVKMTFHKRYQQDRQIKINRQIKSLHDGLIIGGKNLIAALIDALTGIIYRPLKGCRKKIILGFIFGVYQAAAGLIIKPSIGIYDYLISICDGLLNQAIFEEHIMENRSRPPRIFHDKIDKFQYQLVIGIDILTKLKLKPEKYESILYYDEIKVLKRTIREIVLTDLRLVYAKVNIIKFQIYFYFFKYQKNSQVEFSKVILHKIRNVIYNQKKKKFIFQYDIPVKNVIGKKVTEVTILYDDDKKARDFIKILRKHFKQQQIIVNFIQQ